MSAIYHLLDEAEVFSERDGGALSRWVANVVKDGTEIVVCPSFDDSWGFSQDRLYCLPNWSYTNPVHPVLYRLPWTLQKRIYTQVFQPLLKKLRSGDIVYVHNRPECAAVLATLLPSRGVHLILHMQNSHLIFANKGQRAAMKDLPIVFCSGFLQNEFKTAWPEHSGPTQIVYNGADHRKFHVLERKKNPTPEIIFTGRIQPFKGVHVLMEAMRLLQQQGVEANCRIVGGAGFGDWRRTAYIRKLERIQPSNCQMVGYKVGHELAELLRNADIYCCPSIWNDPFPLALLEAMASGLPIVASGRGGIPEALAYGGGLLVPADDARALAAALRKFIENSAYREETGRQALHAFQEHFLWTNIRVKYKSFLQDIAS